MTSKVKYIDGNTISVETNTNTIIPVFAVFQTGQYFPLVAGYASVHHGRKQTWKKEASPKEHVSQLLSWI